MKIAIGSDHAGYKLKLVIEEYLHTKKIPFKDFGCNCPESVDYPDYAYAVAKAVSSGKFSKGILLCGTGIGMSIAVNKFPGIRGALAYNEFAAKMSREHNDANVLILAGRVLSRKKALGILKIWLNAKFEGGRHSKRLNKIKELEKKINHNGHW